MFITELSIKRPTVSWVMSLILIVFGLFVFWKLPVRELPNGIQPPVVQVQVDYKSASASIVDQEVTQVAEDDPFVESFMKMAEHGVAQVRVIPATGAEKFAEFIFNKLGSFIQEETDGRVKVIRVEFREHGKNSAIYEG